MIYLCYNLKTMKRNLYICLIFFTLIYIKAEAQTSTHFVLVPGSLSTQIKGKANDSLSLFYKVTYIGNFDSATFNGWIYTNFVTNNYGFPGIARDSFNTAAQVPALTINSGDTIGLYCHIIVSHPYFNNGKGNLIVIWPTGGRSANHFIVPCADTFRYASAVTISGLAGIDGATDPFSLISIFPNPTSTILNVQNNNPGLVIKLARVMDYAGREVMRRQNDFEKLDVSALKSGTYFLELSSADGDKTVYTFIISR